MIKKAYCIVNNSGIKFNLSSFSYNNIIDFLEQSNLDVLTTMKLDFSKIPLHLHGRGVSNNLLDYFSNNSNNSSLLLEFSYYFLSNGDFRYGDSNEKIDFIITKDNVWQNMTISIDYYKPKPKPKPIPDSGNFITTVDSLNFIVTLNGDRIVAV